MNRTREAPRVVDENGSVLSGVDVALKLLPIIAGQEKQSEWRYKRENLVIIINVMIIIRIMLISI